MQKLVKVLKYILCGVIMLLVQSFAAEGPPKNFTALLAQAKMTFERPHSYTETKTINNRLMNYEYAMKYGERDFEVRFAIRPLEQLLKDYEAKSKKNKLSTDDIDPNKIYEQTFKAALLSIGGGKLPQITTMRRDEVKFEYNADWGATAILEVEKEFAQSYKYCIVIALHKDNAADAYYFFLTGNKDEYTDLMEPALFSLRFK